jgi:hypothetical protein
MKHTQLFEEFINEGKSFQFSFDYNTDEDDVEYIQNILMDAGVDAIAEPGTFDDEMIVKALNAVELRKAKKAIQADGFEINESVVNEANEVSVDKILTPADKKKLKTAFENVITGIDKLTFKKDGTIEGRRGYFYRHGQSPEGVANQLKAALSGQGIEITIVDSYDDFKSWPKDSNFVVVFKLI